MDTLTNLPLDELLIKSTINEECSSEARKVFKAKYSQCNFIVSCPDKENQIQEIQPHSIYVNFNVMKEILTEFGNLVDNIEINFDEIDATVGMEIIPYIADSKSESLSTFKLHNCKAKVFDALKKTFSGVTLLLFSSSASENFDFAVDQKLETFFPNINMLLLDHIKASDWPFIDGSFPKMTFLRLNLPHIGIDELKIDEFLNKNVQIDELRMIGMNLKLLKAVSENLPKLTTLELVSMFEDHLNIQNESIHFGSVKSLTIESNRSDKIPEKIVFDQLQELTLNIKPKITDEWFEFIRNQVNSQLTKLALFTDNLMLEHLRKMPKKLKNLQNVYIDCSSKFLADDVLKILEINKDLNRLEMNIPMAAPEQTNLHQSLPKKWHLHLHSLPFKSKISIER